MIKALKILAVPFIAVLMVLVAVVGLMTGCSTLGLDGDSKPLLTVHPSERRAEVISYKDRAEVMLGMELKGSWDIFFREMTHYWKGKPAIQIPNGERSVGGWQNMYKQEVVMVLGKDGKTGPLTGVHEMAHAILSSNNIKHEQHRIMREHGVPGA